MIQIDMQMPKRCSECPCSYWIQTGEYAGECMCQVMEYQGMEVCETLVEGMKRSDDCPMEEVDEYG